METNGFFSVSFGLGKGLLEGHGISVFSTGMSSAVWSAQKEIFCHIPVPNPQRAGSL